MGLADKTFSSYKGLFAFWTNAITVSAAIHLTDVQKIIAPKSERNLNIHINQPMRSRSTKWIDLCKSVKVIRGF